MQWYNRRRRHSSLGDISPIEFENSLMAEAA
ncbi:IS3 family transposase [Acidithrix ferrooxidans]